METRLNMKHKLDEFMFDTNHDRDCEALTHAGTPEEPRWGPCTCGYEGAVEELAALRQRASDLSLLYRALYFQQDFDMMFNERERTWACYDRASDSPTACLIFVLDADAENLPLLTAEARSALLRAVKGG